MQIHIGRNGQQLGIFTAEQVRSGLVSGKFQPADIAWHEGLGDWRTLESLAVLRPAPAPAPDAPPDSAPAFTLPAAAAKTSAPSSKPRASSRWKLALAVLIVPVVLYFAIPAARVIAPMLSETKAERDCAAGALAILDACKRHAAQHEGRLPLTLDELVKSGLLADAALLHCPLIVDDSRPSYLYFGPGMTLAAPPHKVVLISEGINDKGQRTVIHLDGAVSREVIATLPPLR